MKKRMKISAALLSVNMLVSVLPSAYASDALILSDPLYTVTIDGTETTVQAPTPGFVTTKVHVTNPSNEDATACLVVSVLDNATGKLSAIDVDIQTVPKNGNVNLIKGIILTTNQTHKYYVWDDVLTHTPLRNTPPTTVKNIAGVAKTNGIDLSWDESLDDKGVKSYIIKVNGNDEAKTASTSYQLRGLNRNTSYIYEIVACDAEGLTSKSTSVTASTYNMEECILSENNNPNFSFLENHTNTQSDSYTETDFIGGRNCFVNTYQPRNDGSGTSRQGRFYFPVSSKYIDQDVRNVAVEVTYFDEGTDTPTLQYNAEDGTVGKPISLAPKTNTMTWKTVYVQMNDAKFVNPSDLTNSAFRVVSAVGTRLYKVGLCPGDVYSPDAPHVIFGDNTTDTYDMAFYPVNSNSAYGITYSTINETGCMYAPNGGVFEFDVKDTLEKSTGGYIKVTYYDDGNDTLVLNYNNTAKLTGNVEFTNTKQFKTVQIPLDAAAFSNGIVGAAGKKFDFTLSTKNGSPLALTEVKYVSGDSDYEIPPVTEVYAEVSADGKELEGTLGLHTTESADPSSYDANILYSGKTYTGLPTMLPVGGKHYLYNAEYDNSKHSGTSRTWQNGFYFKIPDDFVYRNDFTTLRIEVEYYVSDGNIRIVYRNSSNAEKELLQTAQTNQWATAVFDFSDVDVFFINSMSNQTDFRINFNRQAYVHKVTVYKDVE